MDEEEIELSVLFGKEQLTVRMQTSSEIVCLKRRLEEQTGVFVRLQKIICRGKILKDADKLSTLPGGSKLMLLATADSASRQPTRETHQRAPAASASLPTGVQPPRIALTERSSTWAKTGLVGLRDAGLSAVPAEAWAVGEACRALDLGNNPQLGRVPAELGTLRTLQRLVLSGCGLTTEGVDWRALGSLGGTLLHLHLDRNRLACVPPEALAGLGKVRDLSLAGNELEELPGTVGEMPALSRLDVSGNALGALPDELGACGALALLDFSRNRVRAIPPALGRCGELQSLLGDRNLVTAVPPEVFRAPSLHTLSLHDCPVTVQQLRDADGWAAFDARRRARHSKAMDAGVLGASNFDEGADADRRRKW